MDEKGENHAYESAREPVDCAFRLARVGHACFGVRQQLDAGGITVQSATGTYVLSGNWVRCSGGPGNYTLDKRVFSAGSVDVKSWNPLVQPNCSDATGAATFSATVSVIVVGTKSVHFSTDNGSTIDPNNPGAVTASETNASVTASSDTTNFPVGTSFTDLDYVDDNVNPVRLFEGAGNVGGDGYADYIGSTDYFIPGTTPIPVGGLTYSDGDGKAEMTAVPTYSSPTVAVASPSLTVNVPVDSDTKYVDVRVGYYTPGAPGTFTIEGSGAATIATPSVHTEAVSIFFSGLTAGTRHVNVFTCGVATPSSCPQSTTGESWYVDSDSATGTFKKIDVTAPSVTETGVAIPTFTAQ